MNDNQVKALQTYHQDRRMKDAVKWMMNAHGSQMYGNQPYWTHPLAVASMIDRATHTDMESYANTYIAALCHDIIEDTVYDEKFLSHLFGEKVAHAVSIVSRNSPQYDGMSYDEFIGAIIASKNDIAIEVKTRDMQCNMRGDKTGMSEARIAKLDAKYGSNVYKLMSALLDLNNAK
jgi:(p)ppGpp synthase/HD superfamily hydrolase